MDASDLFGSVADDISVDALLARLQKELDEWEEFLSDEDDAGDDEGSGGPKRQRRYFGRRRAKRQKKDYECTTLGRHLRDGFYETHPQEFIDRYVLIPA
jgi:hypothetical protein